MPVPELRVGDFVQYRNGSRIRARICQRWDASPYNDRQLETMVHRDEHPMRFANVPWVEVLEHNTPRYTTIVPADLLEKIEPFRIKNTYAAYYFTDEWTSPVR